MNPIPWGENFGVTGVKLMYFLKDFLFYSWAQITKIENILIMTKERLTNIVIFMTLGTGVWLYKSYRENAFIFFKNLLL